MKKSDKIIFGLILGSVLPLMMFMISLAAAYYFKIDEKIMPIVAGASVGVGLILDLIYLKKFMAGLFDLPFLLTGMIYVFFNVLVYGAFMGMPVFNSFLGIVAGYYTGRKVIITNIGSPRREILEKNVYRFTGLILLLICISSTLLALNEESIGSELQHMLGLGFTPNHGLIVAGIITGGIFLLVVQFLLTKLALKSAFIATAK